MKLYRKLRAILQQEVYLEKLPLSLMYNDNNTKEKPNISAA